MSLQFTQSNDIMMTLKEKFTLKKKKKEATMEEHRDSLFLVVYIRVWLCVDEFMFM